MTFCGKPVYKLCNSRIFIHRYFSFYMKLLLRPRTKRLIIPVGRETFGRNGPPGREVFGWNGPPGREVFGRNDPRTGKSSDGTVHRVGKPSGGTIHRVGKPSGGTVHRVGKSSDGTIHRTRKSSDGTVHRVGKPSGGTVRRIRKSSDSMIRGEVSGVFFGTRCMGPASAHLAPLFMRATRPRHSAPAHSKGPARFQLNERRIRAGPPVCVRIWTPHPSTGRLVSTGAESPRQPNFVVR